jgi:hypothetical protein|tara:strand:+ start:90 stop:272 length:183 start_codon:yes stop_codon:yes gene_type:complete
MSWKDILKEDFPKEIMHDGIEYYVTEYLEDGKLGVYHTDDDKAPDQVLHLYLDEAKEKMQ